MHACTCACTHVPPPPRAHAPRHLLSARPLPVFLPPQLLPATGILGCSRLGPACAWFSTVRGCGAPVQCNVSLACDWQCRRSIHSSSIRQLQIQLQQARPAAKGPPPQSTSEVPATHEQHGCAIYLDSITATNLRRQPATAVPAHVPHCVHPALDHDPIKVPHLPAANNCD